MIVGDGLSWAKYVIVDEKSAEPTSNLKSDLMK
jgi:hypothetical protein